MTKTSSQPRVRWRTLFAVLAGLGLVYLLYAPPLERKYFWDESMGVGDSRLLVHRTMVWLWGPFEESLSISGRGRKSLPVWTRDTSLTPVALVEAEETYLITKPWLGYYAQKMGEHCYSVFAFRSSENKWKRLKPDEFVPAAQIHPLIHAGYVNWAARPAFAFWPRGIDTRRAKQEVARTVIPTLDDVNQNRCTWNRPDDYVRTYQISGGG